MAREIQTPHPKRETQKPSPGSTNGEIIEERPANSAPRGDSRCKMLPLLHKMTAIQCGDRTGLVYQSSPRAAASRTVRLNSSGTSRNIPRPYEAWWKKGSGQPAKSRAEPQSVFPFPMDDFVMARCRDSEFRSPVAYGASI